MQDGDILDANIVPNRVGGLGSETCAPQEGKPSIGFIGMAVYPIGNKMGGVLALLEGILTYKPVTTGMTVLSGTCPILNRININNPATDTATVHVA
jgi:hypothetical protein